MSICSTGANGEGSVDVDLTKIIGDFLDCYKNVKIAQEIQATERMRIREATRVMITAIEADTHKFEIVLQEKHIERMQFIQMMWYLLNKNVLEDTDVHLFEMLINSLERNDPLNPVLAGSSSFTALTSGSQKLLP
jgi:hypothetical protein